MSDPTAPGDDLDALAESFLARLRRGERPSLSEIAAGRPDLAGQVLELFPALVEMEDLKRAAESSVRPTALGRVHVVGLLDRVGDYKVERLIGTGGMGVVYEAERESLQARVALKVLHPRYRDDDAYHRRFLNEARSAARLHHSNIVPVFDFGEHEGIFFYAMQFIPGVGLDRVLEDVRRLRGSAPEALAADARLGSTIAGGLLSGRYPGEGSTGAGLAAGERADDPPGPVANAEVSPALSRISSLGVTGNVRYHREVARIGAEVAEALAHAHGRGVLHRDIKPSNLLLDARGTAWVTDFGLAKFDGGEDLTETGDVIGTLRYMAPERIDGQSDARCDIYSLGVTLYEMVALRPAFPGANRGRLVKSLLNDTPRPLRQFDPNVSRDLETVVFKAIARSPSDRYGTASELAAELRRVEANKPIRARRVPPSEQYWRWCKRNPAVAALTAVAAALTVAVAAVSTTAAVWLRWKNDEVKGNLGKVEAAERERSEQLWEANLARARAHRSSRKPGQRFEALAALGRAADLGRELGHPRGRFEALRDEAIAALSLPDIHVGEAVDLPDAASLKDVDPALRRYAARDRDGRVTVRSVGDNGLIAAFPDAPEPRRLAFGPGDFLADLDASRAFRVWDLAAPGRPPVVSLPGRVESWDFAADGRRLVVTLWGGDVIVYDLPSGRRSAEFAAKLSRLEVLARLHPAGPFVAVTSSASAPAFEIRDTATGRTLEVPLPWPSGGSSLACWSADGRRLAVPRVLAERVALFDFDPERFEVRLDRTIVSDLVDSGMQLAFNPEGDRLLGGNGWCGVLVLFDSVSGQALFRTPGRRSPGSPVRFADATRISPGVIDPDASKFHVSTAAEGRECRLLVPRGRGGLSGAVAISPDGRFFVVAGQRGSLTAFDLATGRELGQTRFPDPGTHAYVVFDGTGRLITNSFAGCYRWPVRPDPGDPGAILIGPPERIPFFPGNAAVGASLDGKTLFQAMAGAFGMQNHRGGWIFRDGDPGDPLRVTYGSATAFASVSPDGRLGGFSGETGTHLVETDTGRIVWTAPEIGSRIVFSPDGRRMAVGAYSIRLHDVGTREPGASLGPGTPIGFSADGRTLVVEGRDRELKLVDVATARTLGRFDDPEPDDVTIALARISADGEQILVPHRKGVRVWDLRRIRGGLAELGLDWEAPPLPPPAAARGASRVRFIGGARVHPGVRAAAGLFAGLVAPYLGAAADPRAHLAHARALVRLGLAGPADRHLGRALSLDPHLAEASAERGLLHDRDGEFEAAADDFGRALADGPPDAELAFRRAWALHQAGRDGDAADGLKAAVDFRSPAPPHAPALLTLRAAVLAGAGRGGEARADEAAALARSSDLARDLNTEAWRLLTGRPERRAAAAALVLAGKAVALAPDPTHLNTLATALYRNGRPAEARDLIRSFPAPGPEDLFVLAMAHRRLGEHAAAREAFARAARWRDGLDPQAASAWRDRCELEAEARWELAPAP